MTITTESAPPPSPDGDPDEPSSTGSSKRNLLIVVVVAVLALAAAGWWAFVRDDDVEPNLPEGSGERSTIPPVAEAPPDAEGTAIQELLEAGRELTFHATYTATGDPALIGGELTIEVWRKDGNIRQDSVLVQETTTARTSGFVIDGVTTSCNQTEGGPWTCATDGEPATTEDGLLGSTAAELSGVDVVETDRTTVGEREARCFDFPAGEGGTGTMCFSPDGLPLLLATAGQELTIATLDDSVDDSVFELPAEP